MWRQALKFVAAYEVAVDRWVAARRRGRDAARLHEQLLLARAVATEAVRQCQAAEAELEKLRRRVTEGPGPGAISIADLESPRQVLRWQSG